MSDRQVTTLDLAFVSVVKQRVHRGASRARGAWCMLSYLRVIGRRDRVGLLLNERAHSAGRQHPHLRTVQSLAVDIWGALHAVHNSMMTDPTTNVAPSPNLVLSNPRIRTHAHTHTCAMCLPDFNASHSFTSNCEACTPAGYRTHRGVAVRKQCRSWRYCWCSTNKIIFKIWLSARGWLREILLTVQTRIHRAKLRRQPKSWATNLKNISWTNLKWMHALILRTTPDSTLNPAPIVSETTPAPPHPSSRATHLLLVGRRVRQDHHKLRRPGYELAEHMWADDWLCLVARRHRLRDDVWASNCNGNAWWMFEGLTRVLRGGKVDARMMARPVDGLGEPLAAWRPWRDCAIATHAVHGHTVNALRC